MKDSLVKNKETVKENKKGKNRYKEWPLPLRVSQDEPTTCPKTETQILERTHLWLSGSQRSHWGLHGWNFLEIHPPTVARNSPSKVVGRCCCPLCDGPKCQRVDWWCRSQVPEKPFTLREPVGKSTMGPEKLSSAFYWQLGIVPAGKGEVFKNQL